MPKINELELPVVSLSAHDPDSIAAKLADMKMPLEAMIEVAIYCKRQREKGDTLKVIEEVMRGRIKAVYDKLPAEDRATIRTEVGMVTCAKAGEKITIRDRDTAVENLTDEQIRISYVPNVAALKTILKKDAFDRLVIRTPTKGNIALKDIPASDDYSELDF